MIGDEDWIEADEASCRLLVRLQADDDCDVLANLPSLAGIVVPAHHPKIADLPLLAKNGDFACLIEGGIGADGTFLGRGDDVSEARRRLGERGIVGVAIAENRHAAMLAGEAGADFLTVGQPDRPIDTSLIDFISWWSDVTVLPLAVTGQFDERGMRAAIEAGAAFVFLESVQLDQTTRNMLSRLIA